MNKTKIEWCDYTWNPVTGCWGPGGTAEAPKRCWYCYAYRISMRFYPGDTDITHDCTQPDQLNHPFCSIHEKRYKRSGSPWKYAFTPTFHSYRLWEPAKIKKPSRIFVCSMGDLFGDWVPGWWIGNVICATRENVHHTFIFLTKNPLRYQEMSAWPKNCWLGTTVTNQQDADERIPELLKAQAAVRFVSVEPMLGPVDLRRGMRGQSKLSMSIDLEPRGIDWLIIGALTGPGSKAHQPKPEWVQSLIRQARAANVPVFLKDNLKWPEKIQEWPK